MHLHLYQIWYDESSKPAQNSGMEAFDCRNNPEFLKREIAHLIRFYDEIVKHADNDCYFALFSPRFNEKTGLTIKQVKDFVSNNPNQDIYLFNPFPMHVYLDMNVWEHGERRHTGLKQLTQHLFDTAGVDFDINTKHRNNINNTVYCNYWIASKPFLDHFISFIRQLDLTVDTMPKNQRNNYFIETTYCTKASFYPFIFERIISTFLLINSDYSVEPYIYNVEDAPFKTLKRIDREFYQNGCREIFDNFEKEVNNQESLEKGVILLKETLRPNVSLFPFDTLNRWTSSILKRLNLWRMPRILKKLYKKN
jgi:hypothetical protein